MHFSFVRELFPEFEIIIKTENDIETIYIRNKQFSDAIIIHYFSDNYYTYLFKFATQHRDTSSMEEVIECVRSFANAQKAAIEFYEDGNNRFGGEVEVSFLDNLTYDKLCDRFGCRHNYLVNHTFKVRAWDHNYCFDGYFRKKESGKVDIVKKYVSRSISK